MTLPFELAAEFGRKHVPERVVLTLEVELAGLLRDFDDHHGWRDVVSHFDEGLVELAGQVEGGGGFNRLGPRAKRENDKKCGQPG